VSCQLEVPSLRDIVQPCPRDLITFLEASYQCVVGTIYTDNDYSRRFHSVPATERSIVTIVSLCMSVRTRISETARATRAENSVKFDIVLEIGERTEPPPYVVSKLLCVPQNVHFLFSE